MYIFDYGLAKRYRDPLTGKHIAYKDNKKLTGTARYASVNTHLGFEQSRRDDLECLGYTLIFLMKASLPWQGTQGDTRKEKNDKIMQKKMEISINKLCQGLPTDIITYMYYCRSLGFEDKPDYNSLREQFHQCFVTRGYNIGFLYDWEKEKSKTGKEPASEKKGASSEASGKPEAALQPAKKESVLAVVEDPKLSTAKPMVESAKTTAQKEEEKKRANKVPPIPAIVVVVEDGSCDFNMEDIGETEVSKLNRKSWQIDAVPSEKPVNAEISVPLFKFINNTRHWRQYKDKARLPRFNYSQCDLPRPTEVTTPSWAARPPNSRKTLQLPTVPMY